MTMQLDLSRVPAGTLDPVRAVVDAALSAATNLHPDDVMLVGAHARDLWHTSLGHETKTRPTHDIDIAVALASWDSYRDLTSTFAPTGSNQIRYRIAGIDVDLLAFGGVEHPAGVVTPPPRKEAVSVWAFDEIYDAAVPLDLGLADPIRLPSPSGYAAAKLAAWLDRSSYGEFKDAQDIGIVLSWYFDSSEVSDSLYQTEEGNGVLAAEEYDSDLAAAHWLGRDVAILIGTARTAELLARWPGDKANLGAYLGLSFAPSSSPEHRRRLDHVAALSRGLSTH
ncbi:hypothetical protein [Nocardioides sp. NPDC006303]|uniref:hypothetical protein n=1 Tax=Nocardioides sp. NPDC006303 TaxID=3156747 RepID=UPI00339EFFC0